MSDRRWSGRRPLMAILLTAALAWTILVGPVATGEAFRKPGAIMAAMRTTALLASDTSPEAERAQVELWRRMSPMEKVRTVTEVSRAVQLLSLAGIRRRHPDASDQECMMRLAILKLGRRLACQVYPQAARLRGR